MGSQGSLERINIQHAFLAGKAELTLLVDTINEGFYCRLKCSL